MLTPQRVGWPRRTRDAPGRPPACYAPSRALFVFPDGVVRSCCVNTRPLGNVRRERLIDIWFGERRASLAASIAEHDYSQGCDGCGTEVAVEGPASAYPRQFDLFADRTSDEETWPATLGLYFANTCNLQCVHCDGGLSSSIRKHREGLPPIRTHYDEAFFDDLRTFLPHVRHVLFAGGEPFLIPEVTRTMRMIAEIAPDLECTVITNGTQWNERVAAALEPLRCSIMVSMDAATAETFESVRVGARFDHVLANLDRFADYTARAGTTLGIIYSLMTSNAQDFGPLLVLAEERGIEVTVSVVRDPAHLSIARLPEAELAEVQRVLLDQHDRIAGQLTRNRAAWDRELARVATWVESSSQDRGHLGGPATHTILMFPRRGLGPVDGDAALAELAAQSLDGIVHEVTFAAGDTIETMSPSLCELLGIAPGALDGSPAVELWGAVTARFGRSSALDETAKDDDHVRMVAVFPTIEIHVAAVPLRDASGHAERARMMFVIVPRTGDAVTTGSPRSAG